MKLTKNFSKSEFECTDGSEMPDNVLKNIKSFNYFNTGNYQELTRFIEAEEFKVFKIKNRKFFKYK